MKSSVIDNTKREVLKSELKTAFPSLTDRELKGDTVSQLVSEIALSTHQDEKVISQIVEKQLEYISSKSI